MNQSATTVATEVSLSAPLVGPEPLTPPAPVVPVAPEQAPSLVRLSTEQQQELELRADQFVDAVLALPVEDEKFKERVSAIHHMGNDEIKRAAGASNRMLERPMSSLQGGFFDEQHPISRSLIELRKQVEDLDPSRKGDLFSPSKLFGVFPWGNKLRDYFLSYQSAQDHINKVIESLYKGQDDLKKDNAAIEQEKANLWATMQKLAQYAEVGKKVDAKLETKLAELEYQQPEKARVVREEMLFYVRQKVQDLLTQLAVSIQGYLALDMVRKNNLELIKGVDRATTTTVSALRTAVIVAQALGNQKLVLDQIKALNTTTGNMIEATSVMLKQQSGEIQKQAASSTIEIGKLPRHSPT